jgi:hypothetical protein
VRSSAKSCIFAVTCKIISLCLRKMNFNQDTNFFAMKQLM